MPTLTRLVMIFLFCCLVFFGGMLGLVLWVKPVVSELVIDVPADHIELRPWPVAVPLHPLNISQEEIVQSEENGDE